MPLQATSGAASYDAFGGGVAAVPNYIEDVFSTWLYTGNGSTQTINNGIDLAGKGGLLWLKARSTSGEHALFDTTRGTGTLLNTDSTNAARSETGLASFNTDGFSFANAGSTVAINFNGRTFASWTFRKQPKFFDVVTYNGNSGTNVISHNLNGTVGTVIIKNITSSASWRVWSKGFADAGITNPTIQLNLENTNGISNDSVSLTATSTNITLVGNGINANQNGQQYVMYLFAHNAGGFGLTGTDNVISCGSYTGNGSTQDINLGYEAQWVLVKNATTAGWDWYTIDNMRGFVVNPASPSFTKSLSPNTSGAESDQTAISPSSTGFRLNSGAGAFNQSGQTYIYIAIRRGPMKTPTTGTSVYNGIASSGANGTVLSVGFPADADLWASRGTAEKGFTDRLRGFPVTNAGTMPWLVTQNTTAEASYSGSTTVFNVDNTSATIGSYVGGLSGVHYFLRRAPGFFDEICFNSATAPTSALPHNLGVTPELVIYKSRTGSSNWIVFSSTSFSQYLMLNSNAASAGGITWSATSTTVDLSAVTGSRQDVAYLFASCPGVSKVFNYTGNGSSQTINCGFTGGARFVMIKRTDSTGDWYVWDTARGIVANNDPHLSLNTTAAEVTTNDTIDTDSTGFVVNQVSATNVNVNGASYIGLAIA